MKIETGVITAAGSGTRMLPMTMAYPKELLPIINRPAIQLIIDEYVESGIKKIIIVTGNNAEVLHRQYDVSQTPPRGKYQPLDEFIDKVAGIEIIFVPQEGPYGNGTPLLAASKHIPENEGFLYSFGDDIIKSETPFTRQMIDKHHRTGALQIGTQEVRWEEVSRYGIVQLKEDSADREIDDLIEKPSREEARSNLAIFGRYLLSGEIVRILKETPLGKANELWLTDALREYIRLGGRIEAETVKDGRWLTIGDPTNYMKTVIEYAMSDASLRQAIEPRLRELLD
jgi:UTP--glucose-1-phosphate uridylyltransferase